VALIYRKIEGNVKTIFNENIAAIEQGQVAFKLGLTPTSPKISMQ